MNTNKHNTNTFLHYKEFWLVFTVDFVQPHALFGLSGVAKTSCSATVNVDNNASYKCRVTFYMHIKNSTC